MRVGISLAGLEPGDLPAAEKRVVPLLRALERVGEHEYVVFVPARDRHLAGGLPVVELDDSRPGRGYSRIPLVARAVRSGRGDDRLQAVDVVHYPLTATVPETDGATVVALDEIQHRDMPEFHGPAGRSARRLAFDRAALAADAVLVASDFVRDRAADVLGLDSTRVHVAPPGIDHDLFGPGDEEPQPVLLYPAPAWPHKNHARLLEAFALLRATRPRLRLVLAGSGHERLGPLPEAVTSVGAIPQNELASLYRSSACLVFPSVYEGFGLPVVEAMACGCPVAASNVGALPELCGDAAVLFDPNDPSDIARAVVEADSRRDALRAKGFPQAARFTWEEAARRHEEAFAAAAPAPLAAREG